jgi:hypothetical protein
MALEIRASDIRDDSKEGSVIKICYGEDDRVLTIRCNWSDRQRSERWQSF